MQLTRIIKAPRHRVYAAFLDADAVATWLPPAGMTAEIHAFEPRPGGAYHLSLRYRAPAGRPLEGDALALAHASPSNSLSGRAIHAFGDHAPGKTSGDTDTFHGRFVILVPDTRIVQAGSFVTKDPAYAGEMTISWDLADAPGGTRVTVTCQNAPAGIRPEDHEMGLAATLANLAAFVE